jgi:hypothetical protein
MLNLEEEKKNGSREIDTIEDEIKIIKAEISKLNWEKWF